MPEGEGTHSMRCVTVADPGGAMTPMQARGTHVYEQGATHTAAGGIDRDRRPAATARDAQPAARPPVANSSSSGLAARVQELQGAARVRREGGRSGPPEVAARGPRAYVGRVVTWPKFMETVPVRCGSKAAKVAWQLWT